MSVNPNLAALMRVIEDNQDKMPEGEYLEAMNALGALHREIPAPSPSQLLIGGGFDSDAALSMSLIVPSGDPPSYNDSVNLFASTARLFPPGMIGNITEQRAWESVINKHPDPERQRMSAHEWIEMSYESRYELLREATDYHVTKRELYLTNPHPERCPFMARHAVGLWSLDNENDEWECVCGYTGKTKHWKKHEHSERHIDWAKHRTVSRKKIQKMKSRIHDDEVGDYTKYVYGPTCGAYPGGIRFFGNSQERNEWTHPEMFAEELHQNHEKTENGETTWFVYPRSIQSKKYYNE